MQTQNIQKTWIALLIITLMTFVAFGSWFILQKPSDLSQPSEMPTAVPKIDLITHIPQKALWKNYVTVSVEATPGTICELIYVSPSGATQQTEITADASGLCLWKWKVDETQGRGAGRLIFTVEGISETHFMEIRSSF
jgi:hypothetical protein